MAYKIEKCEACGCERRIAICDVCKAKVPLQGNPFDYITITPSAMGGTLAYHYCSEACARAQLPGVCVDAILERTPRGRS